MNTTEAIIQEEQLSRSFVPAEAQIFEGGDFSVREHLTMVADCNHEVQQVINPYVVSLREADTTGCLSFTPSENFHMTVQYPVQEEALDVSKEVVAAALDRSPFELTIHGVHIRPQGISLACYSPSGELSDLRAKLAEVNGTSFDPNSRLANIGWITIARFVSTPPEGVVDNVLDAMSSSFGLLSLVGNVHVYRSRHRERIGAEMVW
ncbi:MAG: 2'-5' RNA ligase family protein [Candidatus Saccharimonadales bacterium]